MLNTPDHTRSDSASSAPINYAKLSLALILAVLVLRLIALVISPVNLHGDEAQYWSWAQKLDWGYFSKPPLIAWTIASTTAMFGDAEWAVRLSSPLIHACTSVMLFLLGRTLFDARTGFWAMLLYMLMPAVFLSAGIVSTDVTLLLFWTLALYGLTRLRQDLKWRWALLLGFGVGIGFLAKYAMLFFIAALIGALLIDKPMRKAVLSKYGVLAALIAAAIISPNLAWNAANDFATVSHTAANTNMNGGVPFHPAKLAEFWTAQLGVFGPLTFVLYILAIIAAWRSKLSANAKWLSLFVITPLLIISAQALLSRANANWAVTSYIGGALLTAHYITAQLGNIKWAKAGVWLNCLLGVFIVFCALVPSFADAIGQANTFKRVRGWPATVTAVEQAAARGADGAAYSVVATDNRLVFYDLNYYGLTDTRELRMWMQKSVPHNHAEATAPLTRADSAHGPILLVSHYASSEPKFREDFERLEPAGLIDIDLGGGKRRELRLWAGYGYTPTQTR